MRCTQAVYLEGLTRPLGPCLCLTRLMEMHFREDPWYNLSKVSGAWESRACPASLCDLRLVPYTRVGTDQSTSEDSSALLLGFPKPLSFHIPDSHVTMGQAVCPWTSESLSI